MAKLEYQGVSIECIQGNIAHQPDMDAIVNAANAQLRKGGGVAGAIHKAAGPGLEKECIPLGPISPGQAVITGAHNLPNKNVVHCLGPVYGRDNPSDKLLASCYSNALNLADKKGLNSIAFPAISTGIFGYPLEPAARIAIAAVKETIPELESVKHVRLVLFGKPDLETYEKVFTEDEK